MNHEDRSSHVGHIAFVVLAFLIGGILGYYVGSAYEYANNVDDASFSGYFNTLNTHKKAASTASPSAAVATATPTPVQ